MQAIPRHDAYQDSEIPWLGEIPVAWEVERGKWSHTYKKQINDRKQCDNVLSLTLRGVVNNNPDDPEGLVPRDYASYQIFETDDMVFKLIDLENFQTSRVGLVHEKGIMSPAYIRIKPGADAVPRYCYYYYYSLYTQGVYNKIGVGVRSTLNKSDLLEMPILLLPTKEQQRIADFLDRKTAEILKAISKKERLIDLLQEQKAIHINQAVTQGLNPDAPMQDSGIDWIGKVPKHWKMKRAKFLFDEIDERSRTGEEELLSVSHMTGVTPRSEKNINMFMAEDYTGSKLCRPDDLVFNIMWAWMGALGVSGNTGIVSPSYGVYRQKEAGIFNPWYLEHLLRSGQYVAEYNRRSTGLHSSRLRLYSHMFFDMKIGYPEREEQDRIETETRKITARIDNVIMSVEREIEALKELKTVLISEAVTGKIKV